MVLCLQQPSAMFPVGRGSGVRVRHTDKMSEVTPQRFGRGRTFFNAGIDDVHMSDLAIGTPGRPAACSTLFTRLNANHDAH